MNANVCAVAKMAVPIVNVQLEYPGLIDVVGATVYTVAETFVMVSG